ncbi:MAG: helix-turn-helix transcriptional regulator [Collinsella stercoris]|uniref:helix-turn-helix transcriptional regulator n=1 Tax=Collinsella stercoris TaxID=147206 RepID=UPI00399690B2
MSSVIEDLAALPRFLTVKETCAFLGVSASTVKRFVKSGTSDNGPRAGAPQDNARLRRQARRGRSSLHPEQAEID